MFAASIKWEEGDYGLAVLSRWPFESARRHRLDAADVAEPRILLETTVCTDEGPVHVFNHHADNRAQSRDTGLAQLARIAGADVGQRVLVLGDFNERSDEPGVRVLIDARLLDLGAGITDGTARSGRTDYILVAVGSSRDSRACVVHEQERSQRCRRRSGVVISTRAIHPMQ